MLTTTTILPSLILLLLLFSSSSAQDFIYHGFHNANLSLDRTAFIEPNGLLRLTNNTKQSFGHAFFPTPLNLLNSSFSASFVFAIYPQFPDVSAHGLAFALAPTKTLPGCLPSQHLGLFNLTNNNNSNDHIVAVELDTVQSLEFEDIDDNHVGIDINGLHSVNSAPAAYFNGQGFTNLTLVSRQAMQLRVEYDNDKMRLDVTLSPVGIPKPKVPLVSATVNLSELITDAMYIGFSGATGAVTAFHYILGWSFSMNGKAKEFDVSKLPSLPVIKQPTRKRQKLTLVLLASIMVIILIFGGIGVVLMLRRRRKYAEEREDWEVEYGPHRISYRDLYQATKGFREENVLGSGGFGAVYRGMLPNSKLEIAVKRISNESRQGMKEFISEIVTIGRVRHRNLVQLIGYSRRKGELLLVYDYMPNGSLDRYLFDRPEVLLGWSQRFRVIRCIAAGLLYLHEEWEQVVLHRDIKASNVLLDSEFNGRLGDFGLARLYDRGTNPQTTHVVGTLGYLAPELSRTGIATTGSDVYAFGAFLLEVTCGRRPVELKTSGVELVLVDWVLDFLKRGVIVEARDRRMGDGYVSEEVELVLKLGLLCSHPVPMSRPSMRQVVQYLDGDAKVPDMLEDDIVLFASVARENTMFLDSTSSQPMVGSGTLYPFPVSESMFSDGR